MGIIRLLLAAAVVLGHSSPIFGQTLGGGVLAVNCFFVISGFYMAMVLQKKYLRLPTHQWKTFMSARCRSVFRRLPGARDLLTQQEQRSGSMDWRPVVPPVSRARSRPHGHAVKNIAAPGSVFLPVALVVSALLLVVVDHPVERYRQRRLAALIASAPYTEPVPIPHAMAETVA